jgi:hypothetical protein
MSESTRQFDKPFVWLITAFSLYLATFAAFAIPWLRHMGDSVPTYPYLPDEELIVWILSWVSHALLDPQARVFDANIYHPAPAQLTGSEHLFFLQVLFTPLYLLTGQPVLATGIVTFLTYPLGALAMAALLVRLGCSRLVAWICGLAYAVGILRIPFNFHVLQYPNLFLPLVALAAIRARRAPGIGSAFWLFLILLSVLLTSYYIAVIVCVGLAFWVLADLLVARPGRVAFVTTVGLSAPPAVLVAGVLLHPYLAQSEGIVPDGLPYNHAGFLWAFTLISVGYWRSQGDMWRIPFAFLALLGLGGRGDVTWRRMALPGLVLCVAGTAVVIVGLPDGLGQLAAHTPLRNFRGWVRLLLVTDFGLCLLAAAGLDFCQRRFGMRVAIIPIAAFALLTTLPRLTNLSGAMTRLPTASGERADAYRAVKHYTDEFGRGPLLELPSGVTIDSEAMLGSMFHWLPLLNGFTGYAPPHVWAMRAAIGALPDPEALQELVDLGHLRWILMRPNQDWGRPSLGERIRQGLSSSELVGRSFSFDGFTLLEVTASPRRPRWYPAIAMGPKPGTTALGTPIRKLPPAEAVATIEPVDEIGDAPNLRVVKLRVHNAGTTDWPVLSGGPGPQLGPLLQPVDPAFTPLTVHLEARWTPLAEEATQAGQQEVVQNLPLARDVLAGESVVQSFPVPKLPSSGRYRLDVSVVQKDGPELTEPPSHMLHQVVNVNTRASAKSRADGPPGSHSPQPTRGNS